jgi:hypothetical protein
MVLIAVLLRLPFFFVSIDLRALPASLTVNKEAVNMLLGMDVLSGRLPYLHYWDSTPPMVWYAYAPLMLISQGSVTVLRILGCLYAALTGFVLYRTLAANSHEKAGILAGCLYIVLSSFLPAGQSFLTENIAALPLAGVLYFLCIPEKKAQHAKLILLLFSLCILLLPSFVFLTPVVAVALSFYFPLGARAFNFTQLQYAKPLRFTLKDYVFSTVLYALVPLLINAAIYCGLYLFYIGNAKGGFFLNSLYYSIYGFHENNPKNLWVPKFTFLKFWYVCKGYVGNYIHSPFWIMPFLVGCFIVRASIQFFHRKISIGATELLCLSLLLFSMFGIYYKNSINILPQHYIKQLLPMVCIIMAKALMFKWRDAWILLLIALVFSIGNFSKPVWSKYPKLFQINNAKPFNSLRYNDESYRIAKVINTLNLRKRDVMVCGKNDIMYLLTDTMPTYYYLHLKINTSPQMQQKIGSRVANLKIVTNKVRPFFIVSEASAECENIFDDTALLNYLKVYETKRYFLYMRKDQFDSFK